MKQAEIRKEKQSIEARVRLGLQLREQGEQMIADALQEKLSAVEEGVWLAWCKEEFGWGRSTAYRHLNPESLERKREDDRQRQKRLRLGDAAPRQGESGDTARYTQNPDGIKFDEFDELEPVKEAEILHDLIKRHAPPKDLAQVILTELESCIKLLKEIING